MKKQVLFTICIFFCFLLSCGTSKKYEEKKEKQEEEKPPPVPMTVYKDAGPHPVTQEIKTMLKKYPVQTFSIIDNTSSRPKRVSLSSKPISTLKLTDYYIIYTSTDSTETWCWNLRQYAVVTKIQLKTGAPLPSRQINKADGSAPDSTVTEEGYHLYISLN
ncbi:MAG: hypothetical protein JXA60_13645 [Candidatus Coatesbacteria bacterium]|nr:hypothetical protein [Candidatus Coatesbacteria bacterium]